MNVCCCLRHRQWHEIEGFGEADDVVSLVLHADLLLHHLQGVIRVHWWNFQHVDPVHHLLTHVAASCCDQHCTVVACGDVVESSTSGRGWCSVGLLTRHSRGFEQILGFVGVVQYE